MSWLHGIGNNSGAAKVYWKMHEDLLENKKSRRTMKLIIRSTDELWDQVLVFKIQNKLPNLNEAVNLLIELGLEQKVIKPELIRKYN